MTIVYAILILCFIILFHEVGHFIVARLCDIKVNEFSIGMGPKLLQFGKNETKYSIRALPIGGYVRMEGEEESSEDKRAFNKKSVWQRVLVVVAGAFMNFVLGFLISVIISSLAVNLTNNQVSETLDNSPAQQVGIMPGDKIVSINGTKTNIRSDIDYEMSKIQGNPMQIGVKRGKETLYFSITPQYIKQQVEGSDQEYGRYIVGVNFQLDHSVYNILRNSFYEMLFIIKVVFDSIIMLFTGKVSVSELSGPVGIVTAVGTAAKSGLFSILSLSALLTINLGVFNLLPIPALDGGKVLFLIIEAIRKKPIKPEREGMISFIGFALLILLVLFATYNDILRIFMG